MTKKVIITIDGPAAAGKGTIAYLIARRYGLVHLDSGIFYRAAAWLAKREDIELDDEHADRLVEALKRWPVTLERNTDGEGPTTRVWCKDTEIGQHLRTDVISKAASIVGGMLPVREQIKRLQRDALAHSERGVVAEGRDTGIVIFPDADFKFYLTADATIRAQRRHAQLVEAGVEADFTRVFSELQQRDLRDTERAFSALRIPDEAIVIDSSNLTIAQVADRMARRIDGKIAPLEA